MESRGGEKDWGGVRMTPSRGARWRAGNSQARQGTGMARAMMRLPRLHMAQAPPHFCREWNLLSLCPVSAWLQVPFFLSLSHTHPHTQAQTQTLLSVSSSQLQGYCYQATRLPSSAELASYPRTTDLGRLTEGRRLTTHSLPAHTLHSYTHGLPHLLTAQLTPRTTRQTGPVATHRTTAP